MSENEAPTIVVNPSPAPDQIEQAIRATVMTLGFAGAVMGFVSKRDLSGLITYLQSTDALSALLAIAAVAAFLRGQWKTRHRAKQLASVAANPLVPDTIAKTKGI